MNKQVKWSHEKNEWLRIHRGISFEAIIVAIDMGKLLDVIPHENPQYRHQKIYVVDIEGYAFLVPFVENEDHIFLKTAFPSRKASKTYKPKGASHEKKRS